MNKFIIWDTKDGEPARNDDGSFNTGGIVGAISAENVYLRAYAEFPAGRNLGQLTEIGQRIDGVRFRLSGEVGIYTVIRVQ